jgi:hypothetical protein
VDWSILSMVVVHGGVQVLCCEQFWVHRDNLGGVGKGTSGRKFIGM